MFTLTGTLHDHSGAPLKGVPVTVVPSPDRTLDPEGNPIRVGVPRDPVVTNAQGVFAVDLVTGPDLRYLVTTRLPGWEPVWFDAPEDGIVQELRDVVPVSAPSEMTSYVRGASAYEVAVAEGFPGTRAEWVASLRGETGPPNSLEIGTVGSGEAAAATITGAAPSQVLDLVLPKGEQGDPGDPGTDVLAEGGVLTFVPRDTTGAPLNVLSVGDVVTGAPGSEAEVSITGTSPGQTLHFVVPRGDEGAASTVPGPPNSLSVGTVTTGAPGTPAAATISGESPSQTLDLTIPQGPVGDPGEAASLAVGTVSTGAPGSAASASITGTAPEQTLNLVIPRGDPGQKGDDSTVPGPPNSLSVGTVTEGPAGASITGAAPEQTLNLTLPRGSTGPANSLEVGTVTTSPPGSQASATISGAAPEQVLDLTIPRGDKGADSTVPGPPNTLTVGTVTTGAPGSQASATITGTAPSQTLDLAIPQGQPGAPSTVPGPPNTLTVGTVTEGPAGATITGAAPDQTLDLVLPRGNPGPANSLDIGTVTEGPAAASITGTAPSQTLNLVLPRGAKGDPGAVQTVNGQAPDGSGNVEVQASVSLPMQGIAAVGELMTSSFFISRTLTHLRGQTQSVMPLLVSQPIEFDQVQFNMTTPAAVAGVVADIDLLELVDDSWANPISLVSNIPVDDAEGVKAFTITPVQLQPGVVYGFRLYQTNSSDFSIRVVSGGIIGPGVSDSMRAGSSWGHSPVGPDINTALSQFVPVLKIRRSA